MSDRSELELRVETASGRPSRELCKRAARHLAAGELVALPTETVYGIAARADDPAALERLRRLKGRDAARALSWHVASREAVERFEELLPLTRRLAERYWPGPLTLVLRGVPEGLEELERDGWVGVRLPAHPVAQAVIEGLDFPICLSSANRSGSEPCTDGRAVEALFGEGLELVVDAGPCRLGESSGVLRVGSGHFELLREGLLPIEDLRRTAGRRIGFCCTGNTCRSPLAEGLALRLIAERLGVSGRDEHRSIDAFGFQVRSFGTSAHPGVPASRHTLDVLAKQGIDLADHAATPATPELVEGLDEIYGLTRSHVESLRAMLPPGRGRRIALFDPGGRDIADPIGGSLAVYEDCARAIHEALEARALEWV